MKLFKNKSEKTVAKLNNTVQQILKLEDRISKYSDEELRNQTVELKKELSNGKTLDDILPIAFAVCREAAWRVLKMKHFSVQIIGGIILHQGRIAEMCTGEGKTLVATLPAYLNALTGKGVHVVTVNDYLAKRDSEQMGKVFEFLGLTVGTVLQTSTPDEKREAYKCDITYCTNVELGFDYLRDNMAISPQMRMQRGFAYCIIDEIDSILIDEARTPLIISGPGELASGKYQLADEFVRSLSFVKKAEYDAKKEEDVADENKFDYIVDEKAKTAVLTKKGIAKAEKHFGIKNYAQEDNNEMMHFINQSLKAYGVMKKDVDYIVREDNAAIDIVDEFTGRVLEGRRFSDGLHQAIELKEGVKLERETKTLATVTYQNFFRLYEKLSGMTGTAMTEEDEFMGIYGVDVVTIPTNMPIARIDEKDALYRTEKSKFIAVVEEIKDAYERKQPVLVGTTTVEKSELLSKMLKKEKIPHNVLNAKYHEQEANIIAQAGTLGKVTISTNMAGRGTDIMLGGNPRYLAREEMIKNGFSEEDVNLSETIIETDDEHTIELRKTFNDLYEKYKKETDAAKKEVLELGGLYVIGTERHESRRIDNQLRGRSGRQGDNGKSKFFVSFEDDLLRLFGGDKVQEMLEQSEGSDDVLMEGKMITSLIETAQKRVESNHFAIRKNVLEYDEVIDAQRKLVYKQRNQVMETEDVSDIVLKMLEDSVEKMVTECINEALPPEEWNIDLLHTKFNDKITIENISLEGFKDMSVDDIHDLFNEKIKEMYEVKKAILRPIFNNIQKTILLSTIDSCWMDHVDNMAELRRGIGLRSYGQKNPILEYKMEGFEMFDDMSYRIKDGVATKIIDLKIVFANKSEINKEEDINEE